MRLNVALIPQPMKPPMSAAATRSALRGACRRRPSSSMNTVPTSGNAISAETPAAPPAREAGRSSRRHQRPRSARAQSAATPRYAAGASVPIAPPEATVAMMARVRIGARRHGNRSSSPALSTTSLLMSARTTPDGNVRHHAAPGLSVPNPCSTSTVSASPSSGTTTTYQVSWVPREVDARLEHQDHTDDHQPADHPAQRRAEDGGAEARPAIARRPAHRHDPAARGFPW